jgi:hypothetical protein
MAFTPFLFRLGSYVRCRLVDRSFDKPRGLNSPRLCTKSPFLEFRVGRTLAVSLRLTEPSYILIEAMPQKMEQFRHSLIFRLE